MIPLTLGLVGLVVAFFVGRRSVTGKVYRADVVFEKGKDGKWGWWAKDPLSVEKAAARIPLWLRSTNKDEVEAQARRTLTQTRYKLLK